MKTAVWQGKRDVAVEEVPDPRLQEEAVGAGLLPLLTDEDRWAWTPSRPTTCRWTTLPAAYRMFQEKKDGAVEVVFRP